MLSRRCSTALLLCILVFCMALDHVFATVTIRNSSQQKAGEPYSRELRKRELTTMLPEFPQGDMDVMQPLLRPNDPCAPFVNVDHEKREFYSPGYPSETYPNHTECVLVLEAPSGYLIRLDFRDWFEIEWSADCKNDFLEVRDGAHGYDKVLQRPFCGFDFPSELESTDRHLWIHFKSDENIEHKGFKAVYEYIPRPINTPEKMPCRIDRSGEEGFLMRSDIPQKVETFVKEHDMPIDCLWVITVNESKKINIKFPKFALAKPNDCVSNFLDVFSDRTDIPSRRKNFCGSMADSVGSDHNVMFIRFYAEPMAYESSFTALFTAFREKRDNKDENCKDDEFDCEDATCIDQALRCNGNVNCRFQWDEDECGDEGADGSETASKIPISEERMIIIMVIFCLILSGMCFAFVFNCIKKLIRDHHIIQEHIRQSREQQLDQLGKQESLEKTLSMEYHSHSNSSSDSQRFTAANVIVPDNCHVPGGDLLPILLRNEQSLTPNGDPYTNQTVRSYDVESGSQPEMCDSACQTRESLFFPQEYSSGHSTPNHSVNSNSKPSPPAPFSTFGYKKDNKFRAEAKIEVEDKRRPYSVQTTKSAPDVIVTH